MNNYIDYTYYTETFGGTLVPQNEFNKYSMKASNEIRLRTRNVQLSNLDSDTQELIKSTTCEVMEFVYNQEQIKVRMLNISKGTDTLITSEKVGDYSRNLNNLSFDEIKELSSDDTLNVQINNIVEKSLLYTGLIYRGMNVQ